MLTFQCKDGGWASFDKDCTKGILEKVPFADHNAMLDPECADITARILELLGYENFTWKTRRCSKALEFIREHQEEPTARGMAAGVSIIFMAPGRSCAACAPWAGHAPALDSQGARLAGKRPARGWRLGRTLQHLRRPGFQRPGTQHRLPNRLGRHGPVRFDDPNRPSVQNGIEYLIRTQNADGTWSEAEATGTGFPRVFYLKYDMYRNSWPLLALATYRNLFNANGR
jgi:squalene-hopene/tetraprenyl-beta-curcumene cyclase